MPYFAATPPAPASKNILQNSPKHYDNCKEKANHGGVGGRQRGNPSSRLYGWAVSGYILKRDNGCWPCLRVWPRLAIVDAATVQPAACIQTKFAMSVLLPTEAGYYTHKSW